MYNRIPCMGISIFKYNYVLLKRSVPNESNYIRCAENVILKTRVNVILKTRVNVILKTRVNVILKSLVNIVEKGQVVFSVLLLF